MNFKLKEINNKETWEGFFSSVEDKTFLQSWNWGSFNAQRGNNVFRFGVYSGQELIASLLVLEIKARRGSFLFIPHGPNIKKGSHSKKDILFFLLKELKVIARKKRNVCIKIAPLWDRNEKNKNIFSELGFKNAPLHVHPEITWELDLNSSQENLLMDMRKTTRYLIRKGDRNKKLKILNITTLEGLKKFNCLYQITKDRHDFTPFSFKYLKKQFYSFQKDNQISFLLAEYNKEIVSGGVFIFWQGAGFYHHGASSLKYPKVPASYLLMWEGIKEAQKRGCNKFNFWGTAPMDDNNDYDKNHPWAGLTLFKMGFGGKAKKYVKTKDLIVTPAYWLSYIIEKARKIRRGL